MAKKADEFNKKSEIINITTIKCQPFFKKVEHAFLIILAFLFSWQASPLPSKIYF